LLIIAHNEGLDMNDLYDDKRSDYYSTERSEIIDLAPDFSYSVLDIGCGTGATLNLLKKTGRCSLTTGLEISKSATEIAAALVDHVFCVDVEQGGVPDSLGRFDLILMLDVLEHLKDPWSFLQSIVANHLKPDGKIIVSLPNAQHLSLVVPLLLGRFEYTNSGIMDRTHLRFFTLATATSLIKGAGLRIERFVTTGKHFRSLKWFIKIFTLGLASGFLPYQYVFLASAENKSKQ
jgi:2-polyprenyl-3-methyl-5-hydroxy-6-metoxy-1,4-benzoquinol methylase